jgi:E3 ubiquitin-protein ligase RNF115/126
MPDGNRGDYVWDQRGLDNIVTQLLTQFEAQGGVPPLTSDEINALPTVRVTEAMKQRSSQCSVCMDDFDVGESVRKLVCDHFFHDACIIPWVERVRTACYQQVRV